MKSLKQTEDLIRLTLRSGDENFAMAYEKMLSYYSFFDFNYSTNHCKIIGMLYDYTRRKPTYVSISMQCNVSDSTLKRNRKQYVDCFIFYLTEINRSAYEIAFADAGQK